ncbi:hypothetical protein LSCM1_06477 [Leishmania martiniquensis]|uniref:Uncharacterized protein n=1 Tax=Leishmania martiniquensis TaxID=1580590 RepID=A0A836KVW7_9TRYP|nr:hypothetical protein LSCM1_06477 [Leishmania martiniquensis]
MRITAESNLEINPGGTCASAAGGPDETAAAWHVPRSAKAQHALSLFANLRAGLRDSALLQSSGSAAHATSEIRASSAARGGVSVPPSQIHAPDSNGRSSSCTAVSTPGDNAARFRSLSDLRRGSSSSRCDGATAPQVYTDAELESLSPAQLRHQLRVTAAVTQRLHQLLRRLESEVEAWKHKCSEREAKVELGTRHASMQEADTEGPPKPSASPPDGVHSCRCTAALSLATAAAAAATASSDVVATTAPTREASETRTRQLENEVKRLEAHKEALTKRLYVAEQTVGGLRKELQAALDASRVTSCAASTPPGAMNTTTGQRPTEKSWSEELEVKESAESSAQAPPSPSGAAAMVERVGRCSGGAFGGDAAVEVSAAHLRDTVCQLQRRLELSEARVREALQIQLDALLLHRESTPSSVALVNAEVQKLFELMQRQLMSDAVQRQVERARMGELLCQLQSQRL